MRSKLPLLSALSVGAVVLACQTYDFEPVEPLAIAQTTVEEVINARRSKPNIMLMVDTSGSMTLPVNPSPACDVEFEGSIVPCGGEATCNVDVCPTRWTALQSVVPQFLENSGRFVRFALTTYPETQGGTSIPDLCRASTAGSLLKTLPEQEDDDSLLAHANEINTLLQGIPNGGEGRPLGGTPTSGSLNFVGGLEGLQDPSRQNFVILLTDGLPNCNAANPNSGADTALCKCTIENNQCQSGYLHRGCLDSDASVTAVRDLREKGIQTIVIGFGAETAVGDGPAVLEAMAQAGGFERTCNAERPCGEGDTCNPTTGLCNRSFFQAGNQAELASALEEISKAVVLEDPCLIKLDGPQRPSDPKLLVVYVEGERTPSSDSTWTLEEDGVVFKGQTCERILNSTPEAPVRIEVRAIRQR
ncbi:adventurous gliding motility lipoprotein CglB [Myxococcus sp. SDU36]|uniref:adventurous gliding motility lipoprotein CglB n=1 Tax=Myxococcus sp. SDU36 TaxID=2831967 RepID=UPI002543E97C|nr:adventurous gliding motility lipoprotein CglB [Myxococcus sp. SDU36]WIG96689.1 adventurous gliding motility lipoprotein CglB [Myxococcus sp. SDU36]